jgi:hypothetical protein
MRNALGGVFPHFRRSVLHNSQSLDGNEGKEIQISRPPRRGVGWPSRLGGHNQHSSGDGRASWELLEVISVRFDGDRSGFDKGMLVMFVFPVAFVPVPIAIVIVVPIFIIPIVVAVVVIGHNRR